MSTLIEFGFANIVSSAEIRSDSSECSSRHFVKQKARLSSKKKTIRNLFDSDKCAYAFLNDKQTIIEDEETQTMDKTSLIEDTRTHTHTRD